MRRTIFLLFLGILTLLINPSSNSYAEHIFSDKFSYAEYLNLAEISGEKFLLTVNDTSIEIIYGLGGSFDDIGKKIEPAKVSDMWIDEKNKSLIITFNSVPETQTFWINLPLDVISAEKAKYQLLIDNSEKGYELAKFFDVYSMGFILPKDANKVEIIGTNVIPEFGSLTIAVLGVTIFAVLFAFRGKTRFFNYN